MIPSLPKLLFATLTAAAVIVAVSADGTAQTSPAAPAVKINDLLGDPVIAKGKGVEIKRSLLDAEMLNVQAMARAQQQQIPPEQMGLIERQKLNDLISFRLLLNRATDADKAKGKEQFQKLVTRLKADNKLTDAEFEEKLGAQLKTQNLTREDWDKQRIDQATVGAVLERELKVNITEADAKKFYDENTTRFEQPEQVRASHILIATKDLTTNAELTDEQKQAKRKEIEALRKRAVAGEDFAELAKKYSEDPGSKDTGGEYTFGKGRMVPEFEAAAFSLNTNQVSDVITTPYGYHIIKLSEKISAKMVAFSEVVEDLKEGLKSQEMQKQLREGDFLEKLIKDANVEILDPKLKKLDDTLNAEKAAAKPEAK
jgi:peptidyl-prolyl cis-trans isomerase C